MSESEIAGAMGGALVGRPSIILYPNRGPKSDFFGTRALLQLGQLDDDNGKYSAGGSGYYPSGESASRRSFGRTASGGGFSAANVSFIWSMMRSTTAISERKIFL